MKKIDLIIEALEFSLSYTPHYAKHKAALTAARELRDMKPVAWELNLQDESGMSIREIFHSKQRLDNHVEHNTMIRNLTCKVIPLYTLGDADE